MNVSIWASKGTYNFHTITWGNRFHTLMLLWYKWLYPRVVLTLIKGMHEFIPATIHEVITDRMPAILWLREMDSKSDMDDLTSPKMLLSCMPSPKNVLFCIPIDLEGTSTELTASRRSKAKGPFYSMYLLMTPKDPLKRWFTCVPIRQNKLSIATFVKEMFIEVNAQSNLRYLYV